MTTVRMFLQMFAMVLVLAAWSASVMAQAVAPWNEPAGPPNDKAQQAQRLETLRSLVSQFGGAVDPQANLPMALPTGAGSNVSTATTTVDHSHDIALPDAGQFFPTTTEPTKLSSSLQIVLLLSVLTLAPSILLMCTCFTRVVIVMSLLRQALGANQLPPNQVMIGLSLFVTFLVMGPTWERINANAITPYRDNKISQMEAFDRGIGVLREFMITQVVAAHNEEDVYLFYSYAHRGSNELPHEWQDVATTTLVPAYILSELKVAFLMGFRVYLPFLIIDMVISSVLISIGMQLLPPAMVSLPFKLLLFVLVDGWHLITSTLLASFG